MQARAVLYSSSLKLRISADQKLECVVISCTLIRLSRIPNCGLEDSCRNLY